MDFAREISPGQKSQAWLSWEAAHRAKYAELDARGLHGGARKNRIKNWTKKHPHPAWAEMWAVRPVREITTYEVSLFGAFSKVAKAHVNWTEQLRMAISLGDTSCVIPVRKHGWTTGYRFDLVELSKISTKKEEV